MGKFGNNVPKAESVSSKGKVMVKGIFRSHSLKLL